MATEPITRDAQWGHWGICFSERRNPHDYAPSKIHGSFPFPVVNGLGPQDARPGDRERYREMIRAWVEDGILPAGLQS